MRKDSRGSGELIQNLLYNPKIGIGLNRLLSLEFTIEDYRDSKNEVYDFFGSREFEE